MRKRQIVERVGSNLSQKVVVVLAAWLGILAGAAAPAGATAAPQDAAGAPHLQFDGYATRGGAVWAFLSEREEVFVAIEGALILDRYKVVRIEAESVIVEDTSTASRWRLPLVPRSPNRDSAAIPPTMGTPSAAPSQIPEDRPPAAANLPATVAPPAPPNTDAGSAPAGPGIPAGIDPLKTAARRRMHHRR